MKELNLKQSYQTLIGKNFSLKIWFKGKVLIFSLILILMTGFLGCKGHQQSDIPLKKKVKPGVEVFLEKHLDLIKGKKVGLITNPSGIDSNLNSTVDLFYQNPEINLVALYGPEHGVRGNAHMFPFMWMKGTTCLFLAYTASQGVLSWVCSKI